MTTTKKAIHDIQFTYEELSALNDAERALAEISVMFGTQATLMSAETGEIVQLEELNRVRAILDFFVGHRVFEVVT
jgi:hypothetical protein